MRTIKRDIVGAYVFSSDNKILLGKSQKGGVYKDVLIIPGGGMEAGETKIKAVTREMIEEVGIDITRFDVEPIDTVQTGQSEKVLQDTNERVLVEMTFYDFIVRTGKPAADTPVVCDDDIAEAAWYPLSELSRLNLSPPMKMTLQNLGYI